MMPFICTALPGLYCPLKYLIHLAPSGAGRANVLFSTLETKETKIQEVYLRLSDSWSSAFSSKHQFPCALQWRPQCSCVAGKGSLFRESEGVNSLLGVLS